MSEFNGRIVAVVNKSLAAGPAMNALGHIAIALGAKLGKNTLQLVDYKDADGNVYSDISKMPFVILQANSNKIRNLRKEALAAKIEHVTFTHCMTVGRWQEQLEHSSKTSEEDIIFYAIVLFGEVEKVSTMTKKFSLWK